ncbi:2OG-Fe(II) oxygenase, partial [Burkholderia multivorans]|uniref:2OG-Fe(II) oxygenase n=1 Tax=Burkholderia multivorans TaxID=87883 RepID=UPI0028FC2D30
RPIQRPGHQLLDEFRVQVQSLARFNRHFFLAFAWHKVAPWPSVYASHTKVRIGSHQDLYGEHVFPLQVAILLSAPERDFTGGEFVLTEQRPRMQSRAEVMPLAQGDAVVFAVHSRPVQGTRGIYRVNLRHGVSRIRSGHRHTVGIIFHDAQ